jgi:hypothetical protein
MVSLGPPDGGIMLAQPMGTLIQNAEAKAIEIIERRKPFLMQGKLRAFVFYLLWSLCECPQKVFDS